MTAHPDIYTREMTMTDEQLLRRFARDRSEEAMAELVKRYMPLVYGTARRETGDQHIAEDVTQRVFLVLAQKAGSLNVRSTPLQGWLFNVTRLTSKNAVKAERRRRGREAQLIELVRHEHTYPENAWAEIEPRLHDELTRLPQGERDAVMLRFFSDLSLAETGMALGITVPSAQKRVERGLEKLRSRLAPGVSAAIFSALLVEHGRAAAAMSESAVTHGVLSAIDSPPANMWAPYHLQAGFPKASNIWTAAKPLSAAVLCVAVVGGGAFLAIANWHLTEMVNGSMTTANSRIVTTSRDTGAAAPLPKGTPMVIVMATNTAVPSNGIPETLERARKSIRRGIRRLMR